MLSSFTIKRLKTFIFLGACCLFSFSAIAGTPPTASFSTTTNTVVEGMLLNVTPAITGATPMRYAWKKNGAFLPNDTVKTFNRQACTLQDAGVYTCVVSNADGTVETSNTYTLTVTQATGVPVPGVLTNKVYTEGAAIALLLSFTGTNPKATTWQWYKNGQPILTGGNSGPSFGYYAVSNASFSDAGTYYCVVSNSRGTAQTNSITVTVNAATVAPTIGLNGNPVGQTLYLGDKLSLSASLNNASIIKWQKNGVDLPNSSSTVFTINAVAFADSGSYTCVGSNSTGISVSSSAAIVSVLPATAPAIDINLPDSFIVDEAGSFSIGILVRGNVSYQWRKNGVDISPATNISVQSPRYATQAPITLADSGYYACNVTNNFGSTLSHACKIIVVQQPVVLFVNLQSAYAAGGGQVRLFLKGAGAEQFTNFYIDKVPVVAATDGKYYFPYSLVKGPHEVKATTADGKSEVVKTVTIK